MNPLRVVLLVILVAIGLGTRSANAQGVPGTDPNKCLAGKTKCVDKKAAGLLACRSKCQQSPDKCGAVETACADKVRAKFEGTDAATNCFGKLEAKQNPSAPASLCTTTDDSATLETAVDAAVGDVVATLEGNPPAICGDDVAAGNESCDGTDLAGASCESLGYGSGTLGCTAGCGYDLSGCVPAPPPGLCTNGTIEAPESCDGGNLGGASCTSLGYAGGSLACTAFCGYELGGCLCATPAYPATGQTTCFDATGTEVACAGTGQDGDLQAGASLSFHDNGDGTITDLNTGLMWEKWSDDGSVHDYNNPYTWEEAFSVHVATLNGASFAGYNDWRLPNIRELASILDLGRVGPALSPEFDNGCTPGCTVTSCSCADHTIGGIQTWSSTTSVNFLQGAWFVQFSNGVQFGYYKSGQKRVRAVRGGA